MKDLFQTAGRRLWQALPMLLAALMLASTVPACGGDEASKGMSKEELEKMRAESRKKREAKKAKEQKESGPRTIRIVNQRWEFIKPHFNAFLAQKHTERKNVFAPKASTYIQRPALPEEPVAETPEGELPEEAEERGPLQQYSLKEYSVMMIMSGTAVPKAMVVDPKGQAFIVQRDTRIGNKGGTVRSITQYTVMVQEPDAEKPQKLSIKPKYLDLMSQAQREDELGQDDSYLPEDLRRSLDTRSLLAPAEGEGGAGEGPGATPRTLVPPEPPPGGGR